MPDNSPATIATALCAATMAARDAYTVAMGVLPTLTGARQSQSSTSRRTDVVALPSSDESSVSECQHAVLRAVLETRRSYLLALSLANQFIPSASGNSAAATTKPEEDAGIDGRPRLQLVLGTKSPLPAPHFRDLRLVRDNYGTSPVRTAPTRRQHSR